ncbi:virion core protein, T7 gp14 family [Agaricicola taiwanensis]|nr:hypothetical protein [Agaricicola taiwanensis]
MGASAVIGGAGQIQQARATAAAAQYNAQIARNNAILAERRAQDAIVRGMDEEQQKRLHTAALRGQQLVMAAAGNVDTGYGSALDMLVDTTIQGELDALTIRTNAEREAYDARIAGMNQTAQANLYEMEAKSARTSGMFGAAGTLLSGFGGVYTEGRKAGYFKAR